MIEIRNSGYPWSEVGWVVTVTGKELEGGAL
jgi:hypothetical protein